MMMEGMAVLPPVTLNRAAVMIAKVPVIATWKMTDEVMANGSCLVGLEQTEDITLVEYASMVIWS